MPAKKTNELKVGQWVRIQAVEDETDRQSIEVDDNTIGIIIADATHIDDCGYRVRYIDEHDGWYYADELTAIPSYEELAEQHDELLAACEKLVEAEAAFCEAETIGVEWDLLHEAYDLAVAAIAKARGEGADASAESE